MNCFLNFDLNEVNLTNCIQLQSLNLAYCSLINIDLSNCTQLITFYGYYQKVSLTLYENETGGYTHSILLNNPTFGNSAISYSDGVLKSTDNTVTSTSFTVQTNKEGFGLSGTMNFNYSKPQEKEQLKVYPNPTMGELTITNYELQVTNVDVFDITGRKQKAESRRHNDESEIVLDISHLKAGIYLVKIFTDQGEIVKKIIKQ